MAVHWRRGDRSHPETGSTGAAQYEVVQPRAVISFVKRVLELHPQLKSVLLLTNSGRQSEIELLEVMIPTLVRSARGRSRSCYSGGRKSGRRILVNYKTC